MFKQLSDNELRIFGTFKSQVLSMVCQVSPTAIPDIPLAPGDISQGVNVQVSSTACDYFLCEGGPGPWILTQVRRSRSLVFQVIDGPCEADGYL